MIRLHILIFTIVAVASCLAQDIESRLSGNTVAQGFTVIDSGNNDLFTVRGNGNTGIGTANPAFKLSLDSDGGILAKGTFGSGAALPSTSGPVMIWYPMKAAFRAGQSMANNWNDANIGLFSFSGGYGTTASGEGSMATGSNTTASGPSSTAMGGGTIANFFYATALGEVTTASGRASTAMGGGTTASGPYSTAGGYQSTASGYASTAIGYQVTASGAYSTASGYNSTASGIASTALGYQVSASGSRSSAIGSYVSTNGRTGTMYLGDVSSSTTRMAYADNHFYAVFDHGFSFFTDASAGNTYCVYLLNHSTSWLSCSDSTKKTNYQSADGEVVLDRFSRLRLGSWNFVDHDPVRERHYGPMAQEWFSAFGRDGLGVIGNDTSLASADVDGIAYIAIQALERRTRELRKAVEGNAIAMDEIRRKNGEIESLKQEITALRTAVDELRKETARSQPPEEGLFSAAPTR